MIRPSGWRRGFTLSLFVAGLFAVGGGACGVREDEFDCENAVARLAHCCPGFDTTQVDCSYSPGCGNPYPSIDPAQSNCILQSSCSSLQSAGVCDRAAMLSSGSETEITYPSICPSSGPVPADDASSVEPSDAPLVQLACTTPAGCDRGQVCCGLLSPSGSQLLALTVCADVCPNGGFLLCGTSADCPAGNTCVTPVATFAVSVCEPSDGGPSEAASDAPLDTAADAAPDGSIDASTDASSD